jgi:hypothetical protein
VKRGDRKEVKHITGVTPIKPHEVGYSNAAPNKAPHAAKTMVVQLRVSGVQDNIDAAFDFVELCEVELADEEDGDDDVDGAAVEAKETVTLSSAQNCWARFSAEGTLVLQLAATQVYNASGNIL